MADYPREVPLETAIGALKSLGFDTKKTGRYISMSRSDPENPWMPITIPARGILPALILRTVCAQAGIGREEFLGTLRMA